MAELIEEVPCHHKKTELCYSRPLYRAPNKPNAVKVYTVSQESCHIMIQNVPAINLGAQLARLLNNSSTLIKFEKDESIPREQFAEVYLAKYNSLASARYVKKKYDDHSFYGSQLHLSYAPELETVEETCRKLEGYRRSYCKILNGLSSQEGKTKEFKRRNHDAFHPKSSLHNSIQLDSDPSKNVVSNSVKNGKSEWIEQNFSNQQVAQPFLLNTSTISLPANLNISSNPPTQKIFREASDFRPVPRQVKLKQIRTEESIVNQKRRRTKNESLNSNLKHDRDHPKKSSSKNLLISSELVSESVPQTSVDSGLVGVDSPSDTVVLKEFKKKKRRRI